MTIRSASILLVLCLLGVTSLKAQVPSVETFSAIRLEDETTNNYIELRPATLATSYTLTWPASAPSLATGQTRAITIAGPSNAMTWAILPVLTGTTPGLAFFRASDTLTSATEMTWDTSNKTLTLSRSAPNAPLLQATLTGVASATHSSLSITNSSSNAGVSMTKRGLSISSTGSWVGTNTGLEVIVSGGTTTNAATFTGGRVGIGTSTPVATAEINGDIAYTEFNYTSALAATNNNVNFDGLGNKFSLVLINTQTASFILTGFAGGVPGKTFTLINGSSKPLTISSQNLLSAEANRFITPGDDAIVIPEQSTVTFHYSGIRSRWYVGAVSPLNIIGYPLTEATVNATNTVLPTATASYIKVTNSGINRDVTLENGVATGQVLIIQNNNASCCFIRVTGTNVEVAQSDNTLQPGQALFLVWDGTLWQTVSAKS